VLVTSFILSARKLRILLKEMDNRRHNLLTNNKQYTVCEYRTSGAENERLTCSARNIYNTSNTNFYYVLHSCSPHCDSLFLRSFCPPHYYNQFYQSTNKIYRIRMLSHSVMRTQKFVKIGQFFKIITRLCPHCNFIRPTVKPMRAKLFPRTKAINPPLRSV